MKFVNYRRKTYRVFSTAHPSQDLLDDLLPHSQDQESLKGFYYSDPIAPPLSALERVLKRSETKIIQQEISSKFKPEAWYPSRYSDGTWGILYTAESEDTALQESLYHKREFYQEELEQKSVQIDLRSVRLHLVSTQGINLLKEDGLDFQKLTSPDQSGYVYCQGLAKNYIQQGAQLLRAPSARDAKGVCVPVFDPRVVKKDEGHLKYFKIVLSKEETCLFRQVRRLQISTRQSSV